MGFQIPHPKAFSGGQEGRTRYYFYPLDTKVADALIVGSIEMDSNNLVWVVPTDG